MDEWLEIASALNQQRENDALSMLAKIDLTAELTVDGQTALHLAARYRCLRVVRWLLERKAPVDARTRHGMTPLMFAAGGGDVDIVILLLESGADRAAENARGYDAEKIAWTNARVEAANVLQQWEQI